MSHFGVFNLLHILSTFCDFTGLVVDNMPTYLFNMDLSFSVTTQFLTHYPRGYNNKSGMLVEASRRSVSSTLAAVSMQASVLH